MNKPLEEATHAMTDAEYWRAAHDRYVIEPGYRDKYGMIHPPEEGKPANRWVLLRETRTLESIIPIVRPVGIYGDPETARRVQVLIQRTADSDD